MQLQTNLALLQFSGSFYSHSYFIVVSKFSTSYWVICAEECTLPCVLPESIHVITFLIQSRLQTRNLLKGFKIMVYNVGRLSPPYRAIRKPHNFSISRILLHGFRKNIIWGAANMTCCHRGCVSRMRLVQVAILLLISSTFIFTTGTMSTVQAGAESCAGNNAGDKNVVVAAQVIPTGGSIQSHNGKYHCLGRFLGKSVEI